MGRTWCYWVETQSWQLCRSTMIDHGHGHMCQPIYHRLLPSRKFYLLLLSILVTDFQCQKLPRGHHRGHLHGAESCSRITWLGRATSLQASWPVRCLPGWRPFAPSSATWILTHLLRCRSSVPWPSQLFPGSSGRTVRGVLWVQSHFLQQYPPVHKCVFSNRL